MPKRKTSPLTDDDIGFLDIRPAGTDRFHLPALEGDPGLELLFDEVIMKGLLVGDDAHGTVLGRCVRVGEC
jgi:hypothetical protein